MRNGAKLSFPFLSALLILISSCGSSSDEKSAYDKVLEDPAYAVLTDSISKNGKDPELYYHRGLQLNRDKQVLPAIADFRKAWSLAKKEEYALSLTGLLIEKNPEEALAFLSEAITAFPGNFYFRLQKAKALQKQNKPEESLKICEEILQQDGKQVDALIFKSELLQEKKDTIPAIQALETAREVTPFDGDLCHQLAFLYAETKNPKAIWLCDSLIKADTDNSHAEPAYFKGVYYANTGDGNKAIAQFNLAIQNDYNFLDAYLDKGRILYEQKKPADALKVFELATTIDASFADAYFWKGRCQEALGKKEEAIAEYQRAFGFDKTLTEAKAALDRLGK